MDAIRVLILEDDEDIVELISSILTPGYEALSAANGQIGLELAEAAEPDLVICDIMMPVMDGWEFMKSLRAKPGYEHTPVIFLSALSSQENIKKGYQLGAALYLTKPLNPARLKRNIDLFISDHSIEPRPKRKTLSQLKAPAHGAFTLLDPPRPAAAPQPPAAAQQPSAAAPKPTGAAPQPQPAWPHPPAVTPPSPAAAPHATMPHPQPTSPKAQAPHFLSDTTGMRERARILAVDDEREICQLIKMALEGECDVIEAFDGITAMELATRYKPDIFIIDNMIPRMTGAQLTLMLKKTREFAHAPIIFISGKSTQRDREYAANLGVTRFLAKPFTPQQVLALVRELIGAPGFTVQKDRISMRQVMLQNFTHLEAHRKTSETPTLAEMEQQALANKLKKQLS